MMDRENCIDILEKGIRNELSFLEDNQYRFELQNKRAPTEEYSKIISQHQEKIDRIINAIKYLKENLK